MTPLLTTALDVQAAVSVDMSGVEDIVFAIIRSVTIIVAVVWLGIAFVQRNWGVMLVVVVAFIAVSVPIWFPDQTFGALREVGNTVFNTDGGEAGAA